MCPGGAPLAWLWGVRGRALSHPRPLVLSGMRPRTTTRWLSVRGVRAWGPVTNPTARTLASWLCALWGGHEGARGGGLLPGCGASGDGRSATLDRPTFRACGRGPLSTGRGCGVRAWGPGCPSHLILCRGSSCVVRASRVRGTRWPLWLGTCPCAVVVAGGVPLRRASWPRVGAPLFVRSGRSRCSGQLSCRRGAFPHPRSCRSRLYWVAGRGTWRPAENRAHCACRWPLPRQGRWARSASYPFGAPRWGCPWRVPPASVLGCVRCGGLACVDPVTDASGFPYRPSWDGGLGRCTGAVSCARRHRPFWVGGRHARVPRVCACACPAWPGRASRPSGRVLVRLTFPLAVLGALFACWAPSGLGLPCLWLLLVFFLFLFPFPPLVAPPLCPALRVFRPRVPWALASCRPPPFFGPPPLLFLAFPAFRLPWASAPPPFFFPLFLVFSFSVCFSLLFLPVVRCGAGLCVLGRRVCPRVPRWCCPCCCSVCAGWCCVVLAVGPGCPLLSPGGSWCHASVVLSLSGRVARRPVVRRGVSWCSAALCCVLLRCAVVWWCAVVLCRLFASLPAPVVCFLPLRVCCVCSGVSCCVIPVLSALCGAVLRCAGALSSCCACRLCCFWWLVFFVSWSRCLLLGVCWWLWLPGVVVWWCVSALVPVSGLAVPWRLPCGVLLPCAVSCGAVLPCGAVLWCPVCFFCFSPGWWRWFPVVTVGSGLRAGSGSFLFLCSAYAVLCWCACVAALCSVLSCPCGAGWCFVLLPVVFVCLLLGLAVLCCLLVGPGGSWCCVPVACCGVSLGAVLRRVAARCAAWRCVVVRCVVSFCSVWCCRALCCVLGRCLSSWGPVPSGAVFCLVPPRCVFFAVVCRCVVLFAVVLCAVCALGCRVVRFLSSPPCAVLLCGPLSLGALLPCAVPRGAVLPRGAVVSCPAALLTLFLAWVWLYLLRKLLRKFVKYFSLLFLTFENKIKLYTTQHTPVQQNHVRCSVLRATRRS